MGGGGPIGEITVQVLGGRNLPTKSFSGRCNSFVVVHFENQSMEGAIVKNSLNPTWNEMFSFDVYHKSSEKSIRIQVFEKGSLFRQSLLGIVIIPLSKFQESLSFEEWMPFEIKKKNQGEIHIRGNLSPYGDDDEIFRLFVRELNASNNWVVLDPVLDGYQLEDVIETPLLEEATVPEEIQEKKYEFKKEIPEDPELQHFLQNEQKEQERLFQKYLQEQYSCQNCGKNQEPVDCIELNCTHKFCGGCMEEYVLPLLSDPNRIEIECCSKSCKEMIPQWALKRSLSESVFEEFIGRALRAVIESNDAMISCPSCGFIIERIQQNQNLRLSLELSPEEHREEFRFRCRECNSEFCSGCEKIPYHEGYTCLSFEEYLSSRQCRFCKTALCNENNPDDPYNDVCDDEECRERNDCACNEILACGHSCGGIKHEETCLSCLHEDCVDPGCTDSNDYCNICFVEDLGSAPTVQLSCSHFFHYHCVLAKLNQKWPSPRITFNFWNCPICKQKMEHPALEEALKPLEELKQVVSDKALQRLAFEGLDKDESIVNENGRFYKDPLGFSMNRFAYYPCYKCKKPYFGGQVQCDAGDNERPFEEKDLVCGGCSGAGSKECSVHGKDFMEHKCQFCCGVASWFCWGKTHFCDPCHTRQQQGDYVSKYDKEKLPKCPGKEKCPLRIDHPPNGDPFCIGCAACRHQDF